MDQPQEKEQQEALPMEPGHVMSRELLEQQQK